MAKLSEIADIIMGQSPPSTTYNDNGIGLPFFQGKADFGFMFPVPKKFCTEPKKIAQKGDILISVRAPVGPVNLCNIECCIGRGLAAIRSKKIDNMFLYFNLLWLEPKISKYGTGSTFKQINKTQLSEIEVNRLNFNLPEQRKIAAVLSLVQRAIEQQERLIQVTTELKKALMKKLFTEGLHGEPQKMTEIGPVPESWEVVELGEVCEVKSGGTPSKKEKIYWENGTIPWIRSEKCQDCFITDADDFITEEGLKRSSAKIFDKGTVLIAMVGATIGKTGYLLLPSTTNQNVAGLNPINSDKLNSLFLFYCLQSRYNAFAKEKGYKIANLSFIKSFEISIPPLAEQQAIADILSTIDQTIEHHTSKKQKLESIFHTLLHQLMTAQIRVNDLDNLDNIKTEG